MIFYSFADQFCFNFSIHFFYVFCLHFYFSNFEYYEKEAGDRQDILTTYSLRDYPSALQKKITLLKHFKNYLEGAEKNAAISVSKLFLGYYYSNLKYEINYDHLYVFLIFLFLIFFILL